MEEYLEWPEFSVESVSAGGTTTVLGVTDKSVTGDPFFIEDGHMFPTDLSDAEERRVTDYVLDVLRAVGFDHGVAHTEVKYPISLHFLNAIRLASDIFLSEEIGRAHV